MAAQLPAKQPSAPSPAAAVKSPLPSRDLSAEALQQAQASFQALLDRMVRELDAQAHLVRGNRIFVVLTGAGAVAIVALAVVLVIVLYYGARTTIQLLGFSFFTITVWSPAGSPVNPNVYGIVPFIEGTLVTSSIALLIGIPLSLGAAIFLTQQAPASLTGQSGD